VSGLAEAAAQSETAFAEFVDALASDPARREQLTDLLREDHPAYQQRGTATVVRMRGWILLALAKTALSDAALAFVLDELDTGIDPYLVAVAAHALRAYPRPLPAFAPFLVQALANVRYRDDPVALDEYGGYAIGARVTSPVVELLRTLAWLGPNARGSLAELEALASPEGGLPPKRRPELQCALAAMSADAAAGEPREESCCTLESGWADAFRRVIRVRRESESVKSVVFEDQNGASIRFDELFIGHPSIVVFFYTRCDNPLKCSLTVTKLARIQSLLAERGLADRIQTAAITYDPAYDLPNRLSAYGKNRGVRMDARNRMLRAVDGNERLRAHFALGVSFIESLVNRHRIEAYVLDREGRIAASFERVRWDEHEVVNRAVEVLHEGPAAFAGNDTGPSRRDRPSPSMLSEKAPDPSHASLGRRSASPLVATLASVGVAFFPKCPVCWAAYLSFFGIATLEQIPYAPWLLPLLAAAVLVNLLSVWLRARVSGRFGAFYLVAAGAAVIFASNLGIGSEAVAISGVGLTLAGSLLSTLDRVQVRRNRPDAYASEARPSAMRNV
jgi:protein SCO1/2